ncbi:hypothetical protein [Hymenobacter bucti]|uniref:DUF4345 domain-containing protein n=1 Tax=Hymenobacter bucti TaxID=1844114 RepID=A0ABW4R186_9BACT
MKLLVNILRSVGILLVGFAVIALVNFPHDRLLNTIAAGSAINHVPLGTRAEWLSVGLVFLAGVLASAVVGLLDKRPRKPLLVVLLVLFLLVDLAGVFGALASTSLAYRLAIVLLVPIEVGVGYLLSKRLKPDGQLPFV